MSDYNKVFEDFWKDIVCNPDGSLNVEQVKKELADFKFVMDQVPKVYYHVTGGKLSKAMYPADVVIACADDNFNVLLELEIKDRNEDRENMKDRGLIPPKEGGKDERENKMS